MLKLTTSTRACRKNNSLVSRWLMAPLHTVDSSVCLRHLILRHERLQRCSLHDHLADKLAAIARPKEWGSGQSLARFVVFDRTFKHSRAALTALNCPLYAPRERGAMIHETLWLIAGIPHHARPFFPKARCAIAAYHRCCPAHLVPTIAVAKPEKM